jgi:menaquinone-dependent protoporphyrinogen IX oxidase
MKALIIYKGKYGATDQYANWLGNALNLQALQPEQVSSHQLSSAEVLILGTSVYIGKFQIREWLQHNVSLITGKKLFLYVVVGTSLEEKEKLESLVAANVPDEIRNKTEIFFLPGKLEYAKLSWIDKILLRMGAFFTKDAAQKKRMLTDYNEVKRVHLAQIIQSITRYTLTPSENSQYAR